MNAARVARLHLELARIHGELAAELGGEEVSEDEPSRPQPKRTKTPPRPRLVRPEGESDDIAKAKAARFLRQNGYVKVER